MKELVELHDDLVQAQLREVEAGSDLEVLEERIAETRERLRQTGNEVDERKPAVCILRCPANLVQSRARPLLHRLKLRVSTINAIRLCKIFRWRRMIS